jgi:hypothetical protein
MAKRPQKRGLKQVHKNLVSEETAKKISAETLNRKRFLSNRFLRES